MLSSTISLKLKKTRNLIILEKQNTKNPMNNRLLKTRYIELRHKIDEEVITKDEMDEYVTVCNNLLKFYLTKHKYDVKRLIYR